MKKRILLFFCLSWAGGYAFAQSDSTSSSTIEAPKAEKIPHQLILHNDTLIDNYFWLREKNNPKVINYLSAENTYAQRKMKEAEWFQEKLYEEIRSRMQEKDQSIPNKIDSFYYYHKYQEGLQYPIYYRKKDLLSNKEELVLDVNKLVQNNGFIQLGGFWISPDHQTLAYGVDYTGARKLTIYFKDLKTGEVKKEFIKEVGDLVWTNDSKTIFYTQMDTTYRSDKVYRYVLGDKKQLADSLVYYEADSTFSVALDKTTSKKYIILASSGSETTEIRLINANEPLNKPILFHPRKKKVYYHIEHLQDTFFIQTNLDNKNESVKYITSLEQRNFKDWKDYIPAQDSVMLESVMFLNDYYVAMERKAGLQQIKVYDKRSKKTFYLEFDEPAYSLWFNNKPEPDSSLFRFGYSSFTNPGVVYEYDIKSRESKVIKEYKVRGGYNSADYVQERIFATAADGTKVPISMVYRKGIKKDKSNPMLLTGYGAYGMSNSASFSSARLSLLDRGFIYAVAHIRGGGDMGYQWHDDGKMFKKMNTFTDFIAVSEHLINQGYTNPEKLVIEGGSAGGLLIGAVINMRPELYKAAILNVPFVDVINTMLDESLPLTTFEFEEWGNPKIKEQYEYIRQYSPYDNIKAQNYPALLIQGGFNDSQVAYWEPAKFAAKLREYKTDDNTLLLNISMGGGHGLTSGRYNGLKQVSFDYAFILKELGIEEDYGVFRGKVVDPNGEVMPFVSILVKETSAGSSTNMEGEFALDLRKGEYEVRFQHVGFQTKMVKVTPANMNEYWKIQMQTEDVFLKEVEVRADAKDPAYGIIKNAIAKRKEHLEQINAYSNETYIKNITRLTEIPKKWPAFLPKDEMPDSTDLGIVYLSESMSKFHFQQPDRTKEEMIASKVSGLSQGFSWNRASDILVNFYENLVDVSDLAPRGLVSPIAQNAMFFYRYEFEGMKKENGVYINKIKVIPRRASDPVFQGYIYIVEDEWSVSGADFILTKNQIELFDTLTVQQNYAHIQDEAWMPISLHVYANIKIFGIGANTHSYVFYNNYTLNPSFDKKFFGNQTFRVEEAANKKQQLYWHETRPLKLTEEERENYQKGDSLEVRQNSKVYLDSLDEVRNKFRTTDLLNGYGWRNSWRKQSFHVNGLLEALGYNTVEGWNLTFDGNVRQQLAKDRFEYIQYGGAVRYGVGNRHINAKAKFRYYYDMQRHSYFNVEGGKFVVQFNDNDPIKPLFNAAYTLLGLGNYMKIYEKWFIDIEHRTELTNGLVLNTKLKWEDRIPLVNTTGFTGSEDDDTDFTSNNPLAPKKPLSVPFFQHQALSVRANFSIRFKQKYEVNPQFKMIRGSKYPTFNIAFEKGIRGVLGSDINFDYLEVGVNDDMNLGLFGNSRYTVKAGKFLSSDNIAFPDWKHFNGNQTIFLNRKTSGAINSFYLLDYYNYSTNKWFVQAHYEHHFKGFLINKIPLLRKTKFRSVGAFNFLRTPELGNYYELGYGVENILKTIRMDWATSYSDRLKLTSGIRIGLMF